MVSKDLVLIVYTFIIPYGMVLSHNFEFIVL